MSIPALIAALMLTVPVTAQSPGPPDLDAQRTAMKKLSFLAGRWRGEARVLRGAGALVPLMQTEEAQYKLGGLILVIEGVGRTRSDGSPTLQALGIISFDDTTGTYRMRAFNDGRFMETEVKLLDQGKGMTWRFTVGQFVTKSVLQINDKGDWTELAEITVGPQPPRKLMELSVSPEK